MSIVLKKLVVLSCMTLLSAWTPLLAQDTEYKSDPVHSRLVYPPRPTADTPRDERSRVLELTTEVRNNQNLLKRTKAGLYRGEMQLNAQTESQFNTMITQWYLPEMTRYDTASLNEMPKLRQTFYRDFFDTSCPQPVHDHLVKTLLYPYLERIITGEGENAYHPAVRYNAMLIMGRLNEREAVQSGDGALPVAYTPALEFMIKQFNSPNQIDSVRVAALLGMYRHARLDSQRPVDQRQIAGKNREDLRNAMLGILNKQPADDQAKDAHYWLQRRAVEMLGMLRDLGDGNAVVKALNDIIKSEDAPMSLRLAAAEWIPQLNYTSAVAQNIDAVDLTRRFASFAATTCRNELQWIEDEIKEETIRRLKESGADQEEIEALEEEEEEEEAPPAFNPDFFTGGTSGFPSTGGSGRGGYESGDTMQEWSIQPYKLVKARRKMKATIVSVQQAIGRDETTGIRRFAQDAEAKKTIEQVSQVLTELLKATDPPETDTRPDRRPSSPLTPTAPTETDPAKAFTKAFEPKVVEIENEVRALTPEEEIAPPADLFPGGPAGGPAGGPMPGEAAPATGAGGEEPAGEAPAGEAPAGEAPAADEPADAAGAPLFP